MSAGQGTSRKALFLEYTCRTFHSIPVHKSTLISVIFSLTFQWGGGGVNKGVYNFPLPVPFNLCFRLFAFFRLRIIARCCVVFPFFSCFPPPWDPASPPFSPPSRTPPPTLGSRFPPPFHPPPVHLPPPCPLPLFTYFNFDIRSRRLQDDQ